MHMHELSGRNRLWATVFVPFKKRKKKRKHFLVFQVSIDPLRHARKCEKDTTLIRKNKDQIGTSKNKNFPLKKKIIRHDGVAALAQFSVFEGLNDSFFGIELM